MFFELNDGSVINKHWLNAVLIDEQDNTKVVYEMVNGAKRYEQFNTAEQANTRKEEVVIMLTDTILWD